MAEFMRTLIPSAKKDFDPFTYRILCDGKLVDFSPTYDGIIDPGVYDLLHERHPDCPLHELPPHGDLIDRDAILNAEKTKPIAKMMMFGGAYVIDLDVVRDVPVIVPAERRDES